MLGAAVREVKCMISYYNVVIKILALKEVKPCLCDNKYN